MMVLFPAPIIHIGGDEVLHDQWEKSAEVNTYMKQNDISSYIDLQIAFTNAVLTTSNTKHHRMMGWDEIMGAQHQQYQPPRCTRAANISIQRYHSFLERRFTHNE